MLVKLLKGPQPSNILLIVLFGALLWVKLFWTHNFDDQLFFAPFLKTKFLYFNDLQFLNSLLLFTLIIFEAFYIVRLNVKYIFIDRRTYFPAFIYILWMTLMTGSTHFNATVIANLFIIIVVEMVLKIEHGRLNISIVYNTGFLLGLATFFYWPALLIIFPAWFIMLNLHGLTWRGLIAQIIGAATPWLFVVVFYFLSEQMDILTDKLTTDLSFTRELSLGIDYASIKIYITLFLLVLAILFHYTHLINKKIIVRKYYSGFFWFLLTIIISMLLIPSAGQAGITIVAIPATIFLSNQYLTGRSIFIAELNITLLMATTVLWVLVS